MNGYTTMLKIYNGIYESIKQHFGLYRNIRDQIPHMYKTTLTLLVIWKIMSNDHDLRGGPKLIKNKMINENDEIWRKRNKIDDQPNAWW